VRVSLSGSTAQAKFENLPSIEVKYSHTEAPAISDCVHGPAVNFKKTVENWSEGKITATIYPGDALDDKKVPAKFSQIKGIIANCLGAVFRFLS
jgi:TRAP-type C4-dicarboxylate transport system substrate-binding protein